MASLVAFSLIGIPGVDLLRNFAILIMLYIPASILCGWVLGDLLRIVEGRWRRIGVPLACVATLPLVVIGAWQHINIVEPQFVLVTPPDLRAMEWIKAHVPQEAHFLVEGFRISGGVSAVGSDAGWLLPLFSNRRNTMPPQYALGNEQPVEEGYSERVVELVARLETTSPGSEEGVRLLCERGITHSYIGQQQGRIGSGAQPLFSPEDFLASPSFETVYHQDRVYVFAVRPEACPAAAVP
jgi:hypothetical protein